MSESEKQERSEKTSEYINELLKRKEMTVSKMIRDQLDELIRSLRDLRDTQALFDSGEKELIRLQERYMPYFFDILDQYIAMEVSANYDALQRNRKQLQNTISSMNDAVRYVIRLLPMDEIDEANAKAKAEQMRHLLEEQHRNMVK